MNDQPGFPLHSKIVDHYDELKYSLLAAKTFELEHFDFPDIYYKIIETDKRRVNTFI